MFWEEDEFAALGEGKIFFNTSVGPTFDGEALVEWLAGTGNFYVCDQVGMGNLKNSLLPLENVLFTDRVSGHSAQCMERAFPESVGELLSLHGNRRVDELFGPYTFFRGR